MVLQGDTKRPKFSSADTDCAAVLHRYQEAKDLEDDRTETMLKIYEDGSTSSESRHSDNENHRSEYKWDPNSETCPLSLAAEKLKISDYNWPSKQRSQEATNHKEIQI